VEGWEGGSAAVAFFLAMTGLGCADTVANLEKKN